MTQSEQLGSQLRTSIALRSNSDAIPYRIPTQDAGGPAYRHLFEPLRLGGFKARNRTMRVATTAHLAENNRVGPRMIAFYRALARGGVGVIVSEALRVHPLEAEPAGAMLMWDRASLPGMQTLTRAVRDEGALFIAQLNHGGRQHLGRSVPSRMVAPSAIACPRSGGVPHALTLDEIADTIEWFATSALHCIEAGFDGVELHGAQGHLMQQFFSPFSNQRTDLYGGSFENRARFARDIIGRVRRRIGPGPIVGLRLGVEEFTPGGATIEETSRFAALLADDGLINYISLSQGNFNSKDTHLPDRHYPAMPYRSLQSRIKPMVGDLPVVMCTGIQTPDQAEDILGAGEADMIGFCRAFIVDPEWPNKARAGRRHHIRRCIACNQCWGWISEGGAIGCSINPTLGQEHRLGAIEPAPDRRRVLVIGGGPGGLEAARVAALRGHDVTLVERAAELGGRIRTARLAPHFAELGHVTDFLIPQVEELGVHIRTRMEADLALVEREKPDRIILATGATPLVPSIDGDGTVPVLTSDGVIDVEKLGLGDTLIVMDEDGYFWPAAVAEAAASLGKKLLVLTRFFEPFREMPVVSRIATLRELDRRGATMLPNMFVDRIEDGGVVIRHYQSGREATVPDCAAVIWVGLQRSNNELAEILRLQGRIKVSVIGDAYAPRRLPQAIRDGHAAGRAA